MRRRRRRAGNRCRRRRNYHIWSVAGRRSTGAGSLWWGGFNVLGRRRGLCRRSALAFRTRLTLALGDWCHNDFQHRSDGARRLRLALVDDESRRRRRRGIGTGIQQRVHERCELGELARFDLRGAARRRSRGRRGWDGRRSRVRYDLSLDVSRVVVSRPTLSLLWAWCRHRLSGGEKRTGAREAGQHERGSPYCGGARHVYDYLQCKM